MPFWRRLSADRRGQSLAELAITLPVLIAFTFGTISFILAAQGKVVVTNAARNAGRLAAIECGKGNANWETAARNLAQKVLNEGALPTKKYAPVGTTGSQAGTWYMTASCSGPGGYVDLTVEYAQLNLFPPLGWFLNNQKGGMFYFPFKESVVYPVE
ncbi:MAG: hypothetical protein DIU69_01865 [Bacillota bacterium]|nr:MAG: hypothetical protein DIU69_01865 [Bacillota bacterium]